jgi:hypothetical protein
MARDGCVVFIIWIRFEFCSRMGFWEIDQIVTYNLKHFLPDVLRS